MAPRPRFLMTDPSCFDVCYQINPWMAPTAWRPEHLAAAKTASATLKAALQAAGAQVETVGAVRGLPDLVFPANAAVVLDGKALLARFRHPERQGEEAVFRSVFTRLQARGVVGEIVDLPDGVLQEGAGDAIWDAGRGLFWAGHGQRSTRGSIAAIRRTFGQEVVALELASDRFYHLDTCFCPLAGGEVLYYPPAFTPAARARIRANVVSGKLFEASTEDANAFCINAVNIGRQVVMARATPHLRALMARLGYALTEVDLSPFILSGGAAYCMSLRLDRRSDPKARTEPQALEAARHDLVGS
jgi:N-dimethylarginine dimethylaminohydrolase